MRIQRSIQFLLFLFVMLATPTAFFAQIGVSIRIAPPELVAYSQPICPQEGYLWTPGFWAYGQQGYFWVPGTWVEPPTVGFLWTPGYWGWGSDAYFWNDGYWGPSVGFYGGINYGYGYGGVGYQGGYWRNNQFNYNRSVNNVDTRNFHNTYEKSVSNSRAITTVSYNGGNGGTTARANAAEETAAHEHHTPATSAQTGHRNDASQNHEQLQSVNHGKPPVTATSKPGEFTSKAAVAAPATPAESKVAPVHTNTAAAAAPASPAESKAAPVHTNTAVHPKELPPVARAAAPSTGNPKQDQNYQKQQDKLVAKQTQDRQKLQQKQDKEHQQLTKQKAPEAKTQQTEQKHTQQTQQLQQKHTQQTQQMQTKQQPAGGGGEPHASAGGPAQGGNGEHH
jgi:WXXGXW repeat (2 copies)